MKIRFLNLVLAIPIVHVVANVTTNYFDAGTINPGFLRMIYMLLVIIIFFFSYKIQHKSIALAVFLFLGYNLALVLLNENITAPLINFVRIAFPSLLIIIGYTMVNNKKKLDKLFKIYTFVLGAYCVNFIVANLFGLGTSAYLEDSFYTGGTRVGIANEMGALILILLAHSLTANSKKWRIISVVIIVLSAIFILLMLRRGAYITLGAGLFVLFYRLKFEFRTYKYLFLSGLLLVLLYPYYGETFVARYNHRVESREGSLTNIEIEGRFLEAGWVLEDIQRHRPSRVLFGTHNLNSASYFRGRELHIGYMALLHGGGIIGLLLFFNVLLRVVNKERAYYHLIRLNPEARYLHFLFFSLLAAFAAYLITSRLHGFSLTTPVFLMMGAIVGVMKNEAVEATNS
jgi:hypothetical protein